jgi:hypothetical protein
MSLFLFAVIFGVLAGVVHVVRYEIWKRNHREQVARDADREAAGYFK